MAFGGRWWVDLGVPLDGAGLGPQPLGSRDFEKPKPIIQSLTKASRGAVQHQMGPISLWAVPSAGDTR